MIENDLLSLKTKVYSIISEELEKYNQNDLSGSKKTENENR